MEQLKEGHLYIMINANIANYVDSTELAVKITIVGINDNEYHLQIFEDK